MKGEMAEMGGAFVYEWKIKIGKGGKEGLMKIFLKAIRNPIILY